LGIASRGVGKEIDISFCGILLWAMDMEGLWSTGLDAWQGVTEGLANKHRKGVTTVTYNHELSIMMIGRRL